MRKDDEKIGIFKRSIVVFYWYVFFFVVYWFGIFFEVINNSDGDKCFRFFWRIFCLLVNGIWVFLVNELLKGFLLFYIILELLNFIFFFIMILKFFYF